MQPPKSQNTKKIFATPRRNRNLKTFKASLENQTQGARLFSSAATVQRGCPYIEGWQAKVHNCKFFRKCVFDIKICRILCSFLLAKVHITNTNHCGVNHVQIMCIFWDV